MELISYNSELIYAQAQFQRLFNNIRLRRKDSKGNEIIVPCLFSQRSRVMKNLENPDRGKITLPAIYINRTGIERNADRVSNANEHLKSQVGGAIDYDAYVPVPINLTFELTMVTKYPEDMDILLSNFIPFFNQDLYVRLKHPKIEGEKLNHQVIWDGSISEEWPDEIEPADHDIQIATTSFTFKTWIFAGSDLIAEAKRIQTVDFTLSGVPGEDGGFTGGFYEVPTMIDFAKFYEDISTPTITPQYDAFLVNDD